MGNERLKGELIRKYRTDKNMSYGSLAATLGISVSLLRQLEDGYLPRRQRNELLDRLSQITGISVDALVIQTDSRTA